MKRQKSGRRPEPRVAAPTSGAGWLLPIIVVAVAGALTYSNAQSGPFIFDDQATVVQNATIRDLSRLRDVLSPPPHTPVAGRPLVNLSLGLNYALDGLDVTGYHNLNLALHLVCGLLVFGLVRQTLIRRELLPLFPPASGVALALALLWTVHPLNSEVVNYVTQRSESMMALCYLLTMYGSARALTSAGSMRWRVVSIAACIAGMACKETMVTAPLLVLLYDRAFAFGSFRHAFRVRWRFYACLASAWLLLAALVASEGQTVSSGFGTARLSAWNYLLNQTVMLTRYIHLAVWPDELVVYYGWPRELTLSDVWPYGVFIVLLLVLTVAAWLRNPRVAFPAVWFFVTLSPTSSVLPIATEVGAERRMYLPLVGLIAALVVVSRLWSRIAGSAAARPATARMVPTVSWAILATVVALLAARTIVRNREYASALTMATTVLARWPGGNAEYLVGTELAAVGRHAEAIPHLQRAVQGYPAARYALGSELMTLGREAEAIEELQAFVREEPNLLAARSAHLLMGRALEATQQPEKAIEQYRFILQKDPADAEAHGLLADALAARHEYPEAVHHYRAYLASRPNDANAWTGLGITLATAGDRKAAVAAFRSAALADPANNHFRLNLARALLDDGAVEEAATVAEQALARERFNPAALDVMARVLAAQGRFDAARQHFQLALERDPQYLPALEGLRALSSRQ